MTDVPPVSWATLSILVTAVMVSGGAIISVFLWIYRELNALRAEIANFRVEIAHDYVSASSMRNIEARLETTISKLGDRLDRSIENLLNLLRLDKIERVKGGE